MSGPHICEKSCKIYIRVYIPLLQADARHCQMCTVDVESAGGERVATVTEKGFTAWRRAGGGAVGFAIPLGVHDVLTTSRAEMKRLPPGSHTWKLVRKTPIPTECKTELRGCDLWKPV